MKAIKFEANKLHSEQVFIMICGICYNDNWYSYKLRMKGKGKWKRTVTHVVRLTPLPQVKEDKC
jgi:hypothetical protein